MFNFHYQLNIIILRYNLGLDILRKNIAHYLKIYRYIHCDYQQIVIATGFLHSLSLLGEVFLDKDDQVVIEEPTHANAIIIDLV